MRSGTLSENASFLICDCTSKDKRYSCVVNVLAPGGEHLGAIVVQMPLSCGKLHGVKEFHMTLLNGLLLTATGFFLSNEGCAPQPRSRPKSAGENVALSLKTSYLFL